MAFSKFMVSSQGRVAPVVAGLALITIGAVSGGGWWALAVVGLVSLDAGIADIYLFNAIVHLPLRGKVVRASRS